MKKTMYLFAVVLSSVILFTSCKDEKKEVKEEVKVEAESTEAAKEEIAMAKYQCPMKCEGEKTYAEVGTCPTCKMDLREVKKEEDHTGHDH